MVPKEMEDFIRKNKVYQVKTKETLLIECSISKDYGETVFIFDGSDLIRARFSYCEEFSLIENYLCLSLDNEVVISNLKELRMLDKQIKVLLETFNYGFLYAKAQKCEMYCWVDLIFKAKDWEENQFLHCWEKIEKLKLKLLEIEQKLIECSVDNNNNSCYNENTKTYYIGMK